MSNKMSAAIMAGLIYNGEFARRVLPHLKPEYFDGTYQKLFEVYSGHIVKYTTIPSREALDIDLGNAKGITETDYQNITHVIDQLYSDNAASQAEKMSTDWLVEKTKEHCLSKSSYLGVMQVMSILDGTDKVHEKSAIPDILREALNINFDQTVGHDYLTDAESRYEYYHRKEYKIRFPLEMMNKVTKGGVPPKSLMLFVAPTGVGKTVMKTFLAADYLMQNKDVLYITLEMAEERIAERIDANLLDVSLDNLKMVVRDSYINKIEALKKKTTGKLIIKEYAPGTISSAHIRALLDDLKSTQNFKPQVILVDYLNLLTSARMKGGADNGYQYIKSITEELRAIAVDYETLMVTSTQTNRAGLGASSYDMSEISESVGTAFTADIIFAMISTEEFEQLGQLRIKQFKNRFGPLQPSSFMIGMQRDKMKFFDLDLGASMPEPAQSHTMPTTSQQPKQKPSVDTFII